MYKYFRPIFTAHSLTYLGTNVATSLISLLTIPILTHFLSPGQYGEMAIYLAISNGVLWCLELGLPIQRLYVRNHVAPERLSEDIGIFLGLYFISAIPILTLPFLFWETITAWAPIDPWLVMAALLNGCFLTYLTLSYGLWLISQCAFRYALFKVCVSILNLALVMLGLFWFSLGWKAVALGSLVSSLVVFLVSLRDILPRFNVKLRLTKEIIGRNLKTICTVIPLNMALAIVGNAGSLLVAYYASISEGGLYLFALQITAAIPLFYDGIASAILPYLVTVNRYATTRPVTRLALVSAYVTSVCLLTALLIFVIPYIIHWFFPASYSMAIPFITWLAIARCLGGISRPIVEMVIYKTDSLKQISGYYFLTSLMYVGVTILLIQHYGAAAAGIGLIFAYITRIVIILPFAVKMRRQKTL